MDRKRIGTFLLGGLAGVLAGILVAPRSGRETRGSIVNRAGEARERSRETAFDARERVAERLSERSARPQTPRRSPEPTTVGPASRAPRESATERPHLRDVSRDVVTPPEAENAPAEVAPGDDERAEELRRKVQETRERLRARLEGPGGEDGS